MKWLWSIGTVCDNKMTWNQSANSVAAVGFVKSPEMYESWSGKNEVETIVHRLSCTSVVTFRRATWSQPPGWGNRETGGINPGDHNLYKVEIIRGNSEHSSKGFFAVLSLETPSRIDTKWLCRGCSLHFLLKSTQRGYNRSVFCISFYFCNVSLGFKTPYALRNTRISVVTYGMEKIIGLE